MMPQAKMEPKHKHQMLILVVSDHFGITLTVNAKKIVENLYFLMNSSEYIYYQVMYVPTN